MLVDALVRISFHSYGEDLSIHDSAQRSSRGNAGIATMEVDAYKNLYPLQFYKRYHDQNNYPNGSPFTRAQPTFVNLGK